MARKILKLIVIYGSVGFLGPTALARSRGTGDFTPSFYVSTSYGFSTYKSKLVSSNDTSTGLNYELGGYAGQNASFGFSLRNSSTATTFELNSSSNTISWQDTILKYRFSYFYIGPLFTTVSYKVTSAGTELLEASGSGIGGNAGSIIPLGKGALILDIVSVSPSEVVNKLTSEVALKSRLDIDISGSFPITKSIEFMSGYRQQTHQVSTDANYSETYLLTYFGFKFSLSF